MEKGIDYFTVIYYNYNNYNHVKLMSSLSYHLIKYEE